VTPENEPIVLDNPHKNVHSIKGIEDCAFLDIFAPPYSDIREATYFKPHKKSGKIYFLENAPPEDYACEIKDYLGPRVNYAAVDNRTEA